MKKKIAQKCSEGNNGTSEQNDKEIFKSRKFVITYWCTEEPLFTDTMTYLAYGAEICPETKRHHWQAFAYFKYQHTETALAKYLKIESAHDTHPNVLYMRGDFRSNKEYCSKEGTLIEHGKRPAQGERVDLNDIKESIVSGKRSVDEITMDDPYLFHKYGRTMQKIEDIHCRKRRRTVMTKGMWFIGSTGKGKSHASFNIAGENYFLYKNDHTWWDGYCGQEIVVVNEFRGSIPYTDLMELCDKWPFKVTRRGREPMPFTSKLIIVNSKIHPRDMYPDYWDEIEFCRRYDIVDLNAYDWTSMTEDELMQYKGLGSVDHLEFMTDDDVEDC